MDKRNYYLYCGYKDGSGRPRGYIIKCFTDEEVKNREEKNGQVFIKIESSADNNDYLRDPWICYNPHYIKRKPISEGTFWGVLDEFRMK